MKLNEIKRDIDFKLLKGMIDKGFTLAEISSYFNCPYQTIQYYARTRKMGRFKQYRAGLDDDKILNCIDNLKLPQKEVAKRLGHTQPYISERYATLKKWQREKEERMQWLKEQESAKDVAKN